MTRKQRNNLLVQIRRNWRRAQFTALYEDGDMVRTEAVENPMLADERNLIGVTDGEITCEDFREMLP